MPNASYVQSDFRGGVWTSSAQGRLSDERYKTALASSTNALALEAGAWGRRSGFRYIAYPRRGNKAYLRRFRFNVEEAYQAELTDGHLRFIAGLDLVLDATFTMRVITIDTQTPCRVYVNDVGTLANGDIVIFNINVDGNMPSTYQLFNDQFVVSGLDAPSNSFTISYADTGDPVDGTFVAFVPRVIQDTCQRVLDFVTPYTEDYLPYVRIVQATDQAIFLCSPPASTGLAPIKPYTLQVSGLTQFTFAPVDFQDGPYLDAPVDIITGFNNTLSLSGTTGSVTVTAAQTTGINDGDGFKTTDVGRLIWFQGGPAQWSNIAVYLKGDEVLGSDGNIYKSLIKPNIGVDPTTDDGTKWQITAETVTPTWLKITGVTDDKTVTATIEGQEPSSGTATIHWRLGAYSDTTSYPSTGTYHEGRLYLFGAIENRLDGSMAGQPTFFSPTQVDSSVADNNAIAAVLDSNDAEQITGAMSTKDGLVLGTIAGEWLIRASVLDDPITPTSIQARRVSAYGWAPIDPVYAFNAPYFVQSHGRKLMSHRRNYYGDYEAFNHSEKAPGLMTPEIIDLAWVQEPLLTFFALRSDGGIVSCTHRQSILQESFTGWMGPHTHALGRLFRTMSYGPSFDGTQDALYVCSQSADGTGPYWIECMMPMMTDTDAQYIAWHTDASGVGGYVRRMITANGDSFDGLRVYGLRYLNGVTVHPYIGGLDLGNFVVANGSIDIPYSGSFTAAFLEALNDGTDYSNWGIHLRWADAAVTTGPLFPANTINVVDDAGGSVASAESDKLILSKDMTLGWRLNQNPANPDYIRSFDGYTGAVQDEIGSTSAIFNGSPGSKRLHDDASFGSVWCPVDSNLYLDGTAISTYGGLFGLVDFSSYLWSSYSFIDAVTLTESFNVSEMTPQLADWSIATAYTAGNQVRYKHQQWSCLASSTGHAPDLYPAEWANTGVTLDINIAKQVVVVRYQTVPNPLAGATGLSTNQLAVIIGQADDGSFTLMNLVNLTTAGPLTNGITPLVLGDTLVRYHQITGKYAYVARGIEGYDNTQFFIYSHDGTTTAWNTANSVYFYSWTVTGPTPATASSLLVKQLNISDINGSWSHVNLFAAFTDATDGNIVVLAHRDAAGPSRVLKLDKASGAILWNVAAPVDFVSYNMPETYLPPVENSRWGYLATDGTINIINLTNGAWSTVAGVATGFISSTGHDTFDSANGSLIRQAKFLGTAADYMGSWAFDNQPAWAGTTQFNRIWLGLTYTQDQDHRELDATQWFVPNNIGVSFTSQAQMLRPDFGQDAGAVQGPAFGKKRRNHWYGMNLVNSFNLSIGTDFNAMYAVKLQTPGGTAYAAPSLFTGVVSDILNDNYTFDGQLCWKVTRQYPCTVTAIGGYIATQDK